MRAVQRFVPATMNSESDSGKIVPGSLIHRTHTRTTFCICAHCFITPHKRVRFSKWQHGARARGHVRGDNGGREVSQWCIDYVGAGWT